MKLFSAALITVVALIGCREVITNPDPSSPGTGDPSDPSESAPSMYLKGPEDMHVGDTRHFRGEDLSRNGDGPTTLAYSWYWTSPDGGEIEPLDSYRERTFDVTAIRSGVVTVTMTARDTEADSIRGIGKRTFLICPRGITECTAGANP